MGYLSVRAFARAIGVDDKSVREAIDKGRLVAALHENPKNGWVEIDEEIGRREWVDNRDPSAALSAELNGNSLDQDELTPEEKKIVENNNSFASRRAEREFWNAKMARLAYEERSGTLVDATKVRAEAFAFGRRVRDTMLNLPERLATELAAEQDPTKVHARLSEEIRTALRSVVDA